MKLSTSHDCTKKSKYVHVGAIYLISYYTAAQKLGALKLETGLILQLFPTDLPDPTGQAPKSGFSMKALRFQRMNMKE